MITSRSMHVAANGIISLNESCCNECRAPVPLDLTPCGERIPRMRPGSALGKDAAGGPGRGTVPGVWTALRAVGIAVLDFLAFVH